MEKKLIELIKNGDIFIYPTDTVYGIGCNALNKKSVNRIKSIKKRDKNKSMSIIAPNTKWILDNLQADKKRVEKYLPGKYTLILRKKKPNFLNYVSKTETLGIRIPKHEFVKLIAKANVPFITTSANLSGEKAASKLSEIDKSIIHKVDVIFNGGKLSGKPSTLVLEDGSEVKRK